MRAILRGTQFDINPTDGHLCDICENRPATLGGVEYPETRDMPAEYLYICDECHTQ